LGNRLVPDGTEGQTTLDSKNSQRFGTTLFNGDDSWAPLPRSWYVPPGYTLIFCSQNPSQHPLASQSYLVFQAGQLVTDACLQAPTVGNLPFFNISGSPVLSPTVAQCYTEPPVAPSDPNKPTPPPTPPALSLNYPYLLVRRAAAASLDSLQRSACLQNQRFAIGAVSLSQLMQDQTTVCDGLAEAYCYQSDLKAHDPDLYKKRCACLLQQRALDTKYGAHVASACCLGTTVSELFPDVTPCGRGASYQTKAIGAGCCALATCKQFPENSDLQRLAGEHTSITCNNGQTVRLPPTPDHTQGHDGTPKAPSTTHTTLVRALPSWYWGLLGLAAVLLIVTLVLGVLLGTQVEKDPWPSSAPSMQPTQSTVWTAPSVLTDDAL